MTLTDWIARWGHQVPPQAQWETDDMKLTPDELAEAVKALVKDNGDTLTGLTFETRSGIHSYRTIISRDMNGNTRAVFAP